MKRTDWYILAGVAVAALLLKGFSLREQVLAVLAKFIPTVEGFRSTPYWDVNAWRWGYGTPAPGPNGTITREKAFTEMMAYLVNDYEKLFPKIRRRLTANQWAALLSFSYNVGVGDVGNLFSDIESGNDGVLEDHWKQYIYSDGKINQTLIDRRDKEFQLWLT